GGYVGAHAEQINQLQGIAWLPWAFAVVSSQRPAASGQQKGFNTEHTENTERTKQKASNELWAALSLRRVFGLAAVLAMIALSGHTQTLFITGVGLGVYALVPRFMAGREDADTAKADGIHAVPTTSRRGFASLAAHHSSLLLLLAFASLIA